MNRCVKLLVSFINNFHNQIILIFQLKIINQDIKAFS